MMIGQKIRVQGQKPPRTHFMAYIITTGSAEPLFYYCPDKYGRFAVDIFLTLD